MTEYAQDVLIDRILDRCNFKECTNNDLLKIAKRFKAFRQASKEEQAYTLKSVEDVSKLMKSILPLNIKVIRY